MCIGLASDFNAGIGRSTHSRTHARTHARMRMPHRQTYAGLRLRPPFGVQRLEVLVAVMLARERRAQAVAEAGGCPALAAALAALPSGVLQMVADAVAALGPRDSA